MESQDCITIEISGIPVAKGRGRIGRLANGRPLIFTPKKTRDNENLIKMSAGKVMGSAAPIETAVALTVMAYLPVPASYSKKKAADALANLNRPITRPDIDNYVKSALDGINGIVIKDDNQVAILHSYKIFSDRPRLVIEVRPV